MPGAKTALHVYSSRSVDKMATKGIIHKKDRVALQVAARGPHFQVRTARHFWRFSSSIQFCTTIHLGDHIGWAFP